MFLRLIFLSVIALTSLNCFHQSFHSWRRLSHRKLLFEVQQKYQNPRETIKMSDDNNHCGTDQASTESVHMKLYEKVNIDEKNTDDNSTSQVELLTIHQYTHPETNDIVLASNCGKDELDIFKSYFCGNNSQYESEYLVYAEVTVNCILIDDIFMTLH